MDLLLKRINENTPSGDVNYIITEIIKKAIGKNTRYERVNSVMGTLFCAALEFYRRKAAPYEDKKVKENGDVY